MNSSKMKTESQEASSSKRQKLNESLLSSNIRAQSKKAYDDFVRISTVYDDENNAVQNVQRSKAKRTKTLDIETDCHHQEFKNTHHGISYQQKLAMVLCCHAAKLTNEGKNFEFSIATEDPEGGKFDDICIRLKAEDLRCNIFINAKYEKDETKTISWKDLTTTESPFSIMTHDVQASRKQ